jgi:outer membrane protein assembly factor BamA
MYGWQLRYVNPHAYPESRLAIDAATRLDDGRPLIRGLQPLGIATLNAGIIYDSRDDEIFPRRGSFHTAAWRIAGATPTSSGVYWAGINVVVQRYVTLPQRFVFAGRVFIDAMAGHPPFYDLSQGGAFDPNDLPGGAQGIRGVPNGRYSGLLKVVANAELRRLHGGFHLFGSKFQIGTTVFVDTGRVWNDYTFSDVRDGTGLGLKYGVGGGPFLLWDTAALFRIDVAYSPDASAANPGFPVGIYVQGGMMF